VNHADPVTPWYRQFWPWFLIALPATAVAASIATLLIAMKDPDGLVVDDYYKAGLAINKELKRDREAARLGLSAFIRRDPDKGFITVELDSHEPLDFDTLCLDVLHTTRANFDQKLTLQRQADGLYRATLGSDVPQGQWKLQLYSSDASWRLTGRMSLTELSQAQLRPDQ
jgi:hypothetical protein